jgi:hypothetical protein
MSVENAINEIEDMLCDAWQVPFSGGRVLVDASELEHAVHMLRESLPEEVVQARGIVADRAAILGKAEEERKMMIKSAEEKIRRMMAENEIVKLANKRSAEVFAETESRVERMILESEKYLDKLLAKSENLMAENINQVKNARRNIKSIRKEVKA